MGTSHLDQSFSGALLSGTPLDSTSTAGLATKGLQAHRAHQRKMLKVQREFDINYSRLKERERELKMSMLEYSNRVTNMRAARSLDNARNSEDRFSIEVRARNIPRQLPKLTEYNKRSDPLSHSDESMESRLAKYESLDRCSTVPGKQSGKKDRKEAFKINFVTAADLTDVLNKGEHGGFYGTRPRKVWQSKPQTTPREDISNLRISTKKADVKLGSFTASESIALHRQTMKRNLLPDNDGTSLAGNTEDDQESMDLFNEAEQIKAREAKTKAALRDAISKLRDIEERIIARRRSPTGEHSTGDPPPTISVKIRTKKAKRLRMPKVPLDAIPEIDREDTTTSIKKRETEAEPQRQSTPIPSNSRHSLETISESNKDPDLGEYDINPYKGFARSDAPKDYSLRRESYDSMKARESMTLNMRNFKQSRPQDSTTDSSIEESFPAYASQQYWNNAGTKKGESYRSKKLQYHMKKRSKVQKLKYLKAS